MNRLQTLYTDADRAITRWMGRNGVTLLRISLGLIFLWFGLLKFFPSIPLPESEQLGAQVLQRFSFGLISPPGGTRVLGALETVIGLGLLAGRFLRTVLFLLFGQMIGTFTPMFLFPGEVFARMPYAPTLLGMYIIKNFVLISAAIVIGATVRGARIRPDFETTFQTKKPK